ncbi:MAG: cobyrinate a,c-diamide synthase [Rhodospirillaceae bacterium]|nr:cobyrinate a,c-diamide synthase [Rhodospirillaceae bacterium]
MTAPGLIIAAPASGSGKTTITLGLLRALSRRGLAVASAKVGPDYIDPGFHTAASGQACRTLDGWAMRPETLARQIGALDGEIIITEGVMGLFDGAAKPGAGDDGSTAGLAASTGWPVVLVVDCARQAQSVAALVAGFQQHRSDVRLAAVVLNRVGSERHREMLQAALEPLGIPVLGAIRRAKTITLPSRHLGLVLAEEHRALESFIDTAADLVSEGLDLDLLHSLAKPAHAKSRGSTVSIPPLGQRIAVARDQAFAFVYPHILEDWRAAGAEILTFSPLAGEAPDVAADAVYLPGGYPELHAGTIAANTKMLVRLREMADAGCPIHGECGGYMVLGDGLIDGDGVRHAMAGLLSLTTSFAEPQMTLGYRRAELLGNTVLGSAGSGFRGHEFHYASEIETGADEPLLRAHDASGRDLGDHGLRRGSVTGAFLHLIDRA